MQSLPNYYQTRQDNTLAPQSQPVNGWHTWTSNQLVAQDRSRGHYAGPPPLELTQETVLRRSDDTWLADKWVNSSTSAPRHNRASGPSTAARHAVVVNGAAHGNERPSAAQSVSSSPHVVDRNLSRDEPPHFNSQNSPSTRTVTFPSVPYPTLQVNGRESDLQPPPTHDSRDAVELQLGRSGPHYGHATAEVPAQPSHLQMQPLSQTNAYAAGPSNSNNYLDFQYAPNTSQLQRYNQGLAMQMAPRYSEPLVAAAPPNVLYNYSNQTTNVPHMPYYYPSQAMQYAHLLQASMNQAAPMLPPMLEAAPSYNFGNIYASGLSSSMNEYPPSPAYPQQGATPGTGRSTYLQNQNRGIRPRRSSETQTRSLRVRRTQHPQETRSAVLELYHDQCKIRHFELKDIFGHIVEFSGDQYGSRFLQEKLELAISEDRDAVYQEIVPGSALQLMKDVFGNYVIQRLFERCTQSQKAALADCMKGHVFALSLEAYGCRVVQKAMGCVLPEQQEMFARELEANIYDCIRNTHGNHVIQQAVQSLHVHRRRILRTFRGHVVALAMHNFGCRVLQRCFEYLPPMDTQFLFEEMRQKMLYLIQDQYANYVIQFILKHGTGSTRNSEIISHIKGRLHYLACHKYASNVCEMAFEHGSLADRTALVNEVMAAEEGKPPLFVALMRDPYGNYVLQRAIHQTTDSKRLELISQARPYLVELRQKAPAYSKYLVNVEKKMNEYVPRSQGDSDTSTSTPIETQVA